MQFSLPPATPGFISVPPPASEAEASKLVPGLDEMPPTAFAAVLDDEVSPPGLLAANSHGSTPGVSPRTPLSKDQAEAAAANLGGTTNNLTAPSRNLLAPPLPVAVPFSSGGLADGQALASTLLPDGTANPRQLLPRPLTKVGVAPSRAEEEQAAAFALTATVPVYNVSLSGEITPALTGGSEAGENLSAFPSVPLSPGLGSNGADAASRQMFVRGGQFSWITNQSESALTAAGRIGQVDEGAARRNGNGAVLAGSISDPVADAPANSGRFSENPALFRTELSPENASGKISARLAVQKQIDAAPMAPPVALEKIPSSLPPPSIRLGAGVVNEAEAATVVASTAAGAAVAVSDSALSAARPGARGKAEKFSTSLGLPVPNGEIRSVDAGLKKILSAEPQLDSEQLFSVGTGVAQPNGKMRPDSQSPFAAVQQVEDISIAATAVAGLSEAMAALAPQDNRVGPQVAAPIAAPRMQSVVNHVVELSHRLDTQSVSSMAMRFNFGGDEKLSVQVELRDGAVHTVFRTDSPVLRETLGTAWREMAPANTIAEGRTVRLAEPSIIRDTPDAGFSAQSGGGDHRSQQNPHHHPSTAEFADASFALAAGRSRAVRRLAALVEPASGSPSLRPETVRHLHAVA